MAVVVEMHNTGNPEARAEVVAMITTSGVGSNGAVSTVVTDTSVMLCGQPRWGYSPGLER
jgi:alcohol dehydrogenase class IV